MCSYKAKILQKKFAPGQRIIVISDVHANLLYLKELLKKISFDKEDILILDGDFLEKGPDSIGTLHYIMELTKCGNVYPLLGNCDGWHTVPALRDEEEAAHLQKYFQFRKSGLLFEMLTEQGYDPLNLPENLTEIFGSLGELYPEEFNFLAGLPHIIETEKFVFVHAGLQKDKPLAEHTEDDVTVIRHFMTEAPAFDCWVIVGHWPLVLYGEDIVCANPIIDRERKIISIDGGCVLKDDGQLNALIIPDASKEEFETAYYDPFPVKTAAEDQSEGERSYYIRWGDSLVEVLERGKEFSRCRHARTGYEMDILTKYLFRETSPTECNDCTDYILPVKKGDRLSIVETTSRGYFVKKNGISGWYFGKLTEE